MIKTLRLEEHEMHVVYKALENYKTMLADMNQTFSKGEVAELYKEEIDIILDMMLERVEIINMILDIIIGERDMCCAEEDDEE